MTSWASGSAANPVFDLLPAVYRERDARPDGRPGFLQSLLAVVADQLHLVTDDLSQLYDDLFVETCDAWVLPYIGDLVAVTPGAPVDDDAVLTRAAVTDAIALRRRKGTASVLEQLAHDYTGWPAVVVEMFSRLAVAQHLQHVAADRGRTVSLRSAAALEQLGRSFDGAAHSLEVRRIGDGRGRYAVPNIAIMVWRDQSMTHTWCDAVAVDARRFRFSPMGCDTQLINRWKTEITVTHQASARNVPGRITRRAMAASPDAFYGAANGVAVRRPGDTDPIAPADVVVCDLSDSTADGSTWSNVARLAPGQLAIDPELGRLAFGADQPDPPLVSFVTTQPSDTGGSELRDRPDTPEDSAVTPVRRDGAGGAASTITAALAACGGVGTLQVQDSRTYAGDLTVSVPEGAQLRLVSTRGACPVIDLATAATVTVGEHGVLTLIGVVVAGGPLIIRGRPDSVEIRDSTFVPGGRLDAGAGVPPPARPSIVLDIDDDWQTELRIDNCVCGPLLLPADGTRVGITDSIVDDVAGGLGRAAGLGAPARIVPALRATDPPPPFSAGPATTSLRLTLGTDAPRLITLPAVPSDVADAASLLDAELAGTGARAVSLTDRVALLGDGRPLAVQTAPGSDLATVLGLTGPGVATRAVLGGPVDLAAAAAGGTVAVVDRSGTAVTVPIPPGAGGLDGLAMIVQAAVSTAGASLAGTHVGVLDSALVLLPPVSGPLMVSPEGSAPGMAVALGLVSPWPAIAADPSGTPGATLSLTRCTVWGTVRVTALDVVRDSIVTGPLISDRRQTGCLEYSWIAPGSSTVPGYQCRPLAGDPPAPVFVSTHFARPGYARLRRAGAGAVIRAASDGYEMGALARLHQTQRDDNLRRAVAEFLRFGLEAGVLDGT